ncbi:PREDICTED: PRADC1-like protein [Papilio xuthus]|uniref:PRADC1-like protein n=1 Tax=Papilio xuthus TaxID=66420 RepID=A0A0N1IN81_PAPXU|nr:PREDICTED: PRADC1-like protein [Papilio xuthus]KPJ04292.1 PRADC1-like protein [Papilio xuthus]
MIMFHGILNVCTYLQLYLFISLIIFVNVASPGANDLHFNDGASIADVIAGDVFFEIIDPPELRYTYRIRPAKDFGATFNESLQFEKTRLVPTLPLHSCGDILNNEEVFGHIALSERGECSFVYKTAKAQQAGARAIIITESVDKWDDTLDHLIEMVDDKMDLDVNIPAAFLLGRSGATILKTLKKLRRNYAIINLPVNMTHVPINKMNQPPWISW